MSERALSSSGLPEPESTSTQATSEAPERLPRKLSTHLWKGVLVVGGLLAAMGVVILPPVLSPTIPQAQLTERIEQVQNEANAWLKSIPAPSLAGTDLSVIVVEPAIHEARAMDPTPLPPTPPPPHPFPKAEANVSAS